MNPFDTFEFASQTQKRRKKVLSEVMPVGDNFTYFILLSDGYLTNHDTEQHICNFDDLGRALGCTDDLQEIQLVRAEGRLTEGRHALPDLVAGYLAGVGEGHLLVRRWSYGNAEPVISTVARSAIRDGWADPEFEEVEVADPTGKWYFRARDDDPLIFLAVNDAALIDKLRRCNKFCREVTGDFLYAP